MVPQTCLHPKCVDQFAAFWSDVRAGRQQLGEVQLKALDRWHEYLFPIGRGIETLPLEYFLQLFDDYLFRGALANRVTVKWMDGSHDWSIVKGRTLSTFIPSAGDLYVRIDINKPFCSIWSPLLVVSILGVLLHEMVHAYCMIYVHPRGQHGYAARARACGITGHGPSWRTISLAIESELRRSFRGLIALDHSISPFRPDDLGGRLPSKWVLGVDGSCQQERRALLHLVRNNRLLMTTEEAQVVFWNYRDQMRRARLKEINPVTDISKALPYFLKGLSRR